jgi:hypothetical protein
VERSSVAAGAALAANIQHPTLNSELPRDGNFGIRRTLNAERLTLNAKVRRAGGVRMEFPVVGSWAFMAVQ